MKARVLVVDDEPLKRITLRIELSEAGYQVLEAADGVEARRLIDSTPIDVVVSDLRMPGLDGLQLLSHVRSVQPSARVLMMTAYGSVETAVTAIKLGAEDFITKPFTTQDLVAKLESFSSALPADTQPRPSGDPPHAAMLDPSRASAELPTLLDQRIGLHETVSDIERRLILLALKRCGNNQVRAALALGIPRTTLRDKMARHGIPLGA